MAATAGIGSTVVPLATQVQRLEGSGGSGGLFVANQGNLQIGGISSSLLGLTGLAAINSDIVVTVIGTLTTVENTSTTAGGDVDLSATGDIVIQAPITSQAGAIDLEAQQDLRVETTSISSVSGPISLLAGGAIALTDGALIDAGSGTIGLTAGGNITLGRLVTTNSTASAVSITSLTGSILDGGDSGGPNVVAEGAGAVVTITAAQGVGTAASPLDLAVRNLVVTSGGNQYLSELDNLSSLDLDAGSANIHLTAGGTIQDGDGAVDIAANQLVLSAASAGTAAQPLQTQLASLIASVSAGNLHLTESDGLTVISAAASSGNISLRSLAGNLVIQSVQAQGLVTLLAQSGAILSGAAGTNVTATNLELSAGAGIGTAAALLATQVQRLEGSGGSGGLFVSNQGNLQVGGISPSLLGLTGLAAINGDIVVTVIGTLTAVETTSTTAGGDVDLSATGDIVIQAPITSQAGSIDLEAQQDLRVETTSISSVSGPISLLAGGAIALADGALINAGSGTIGLTAGGDITLGRLVTTNSTASAVSITSLTGSILDGGDSGGPNIVAEGLGAVVTITAAQGVGTSSSPLDLAVRNLVVTSGGNQYLNELDSLSSLDLDAGSANIHLTAGGQVNDSDSAVDIKAGGMAIVAEGAGSLSNPLQTNLARLEAEVGAGGLVLVDAGGLELGGVTDSIKGVHSNDGPLKITAGGFLLISEAVGASGSGSIQLIAAADISLAARIGSESGNISLLAAGDILAGAGSGIDTLEGTVLLRADQDNLGGGTIHFAGDIDVGFGQVIFHFPDADGQLSGSIQGRGGLVKQGAGTLTLTQTSINTYTGTTQVLGGTLRVNGTIGSAGPAGTLSLAGGTTLTGGGDINAPIFSVETTARIVSTGDLQLGDGSADGFDFAGTFLIGGGDQVTLRDADLARLGILTMIQGGGHLTALGGVEVGNHERLSGSGAVSGNIVVLAGGMVSPGASPGVVSTLKGDVVLFADAIYLAEIDGTRAGAQYDQINVQGTVDVSGAVLSISGGRFRPPTGTVFTLIANDDAGGVVDRVSGEFRGLPEGATIRFGAIEAKISYVGGSGNDITLTVSDLRLIRSLTPGAVALIRDDTGGGGAISLARKAESPPVLFSESARPAAISQGTDARPQALETRAVERLRVFLKVVDEVTKKEEGKEVDLDPRVIDDVLGFFQRYRFPNGRYRIYVQEAGKAPRLIIEIVIRDGRAVTPEVESPALKQEAPAPAQPALEQPAQEQPAPAQEQPARPADPAAARPLAQPTRAAAMAAPAGHRDTGGDADAAAARYPAGVHRWSAAAAPLAVGLAGAACSSWRERIQQLLSAPDRLPRTRFHRPRVTSPGTSPESL
jgi:autotransporter-associated beta strand protein